MTGPLPKSNDLRMYLLMRADLGDVPVGKLLGQAGHAFAHALQDAPEEDRATYHRDPAHAKIVLRCKDIEELQMTLDACKAVKVPFHKQIDLGLTILTEPTFTCVAIGPIPRSTANQLGLWKFPLY